MAENIFNSTHALLAKHLYALLSSMSHDQREGAILTLTTLNVLVEDGYLSLNQKSLEVDFYTHCYDTLVASALCLKMLSDDGLISENTDQSVKGFSPDQHLKEADLALVRVERLMRLIGRTPETTQ